MKLNFSIKLHLLAVGIVSFLYVIIDHPHITLILGGSMIFITYIYIGLFEAKESALFFTPITYYFFWYSINLGLAAIYFGYLIFGNERIQFSGATVNYNSIATGYLIFIIGSFFLHLGLQTVILKRITVDINKPLNLSIGFKSIWALLIISFLYLSSDTIGSILGGIATPLRYGMIAAFSLVAIIPNHYLKISKNKQLLMLIAGVTIIFSTNISTTSKAYMMFAFFPLAWHLMINKSRRRLILILFSFLVPFYLFVIYPLSYELRSQTLFGGEMNKTEAFKNVLSDKSTASTAFGQKDHPFFAYLHRSFDPLAISYLNQQVENYGYMGGQTLSYLAYAMIPRILWPSKPTVTQGGWFAYYLGFSRSPESSTMSLGISATGELYWNFGFPGVILGMFFIGLLISYTWRVVGADPRYSAISMLIYVNLLFLMANMSEAGTVFSSLVILLLFHKSFSFINKTFLQNKRRKNELFSKKQLISPQSKY